MSRSLRADLSSIVGSSGVLTDRDVVRRYEVGARYGNGRARAVVRPVSSAEVSATIRYCYANDLRVVAQGANTGLVAASTPDPSGDQLVLSLERLQGLVSIDCSNRSAHVLAGTRLGTLNEALASHGLQFPIDLSADPTIGGMISTNTGGTRLIRYGDVRRNTLGLEVVLADRDATIISDLKGLRKDNSGIDLKQVFVGTGGALGIVTAAQLEVHYLPKQSSTALVVPADGAAIPLLLDRLEADLGEFLTAFEGMSQNAMELALRHNPRLRNPFAPGPTPSYAILVELASTVGRGSGLDLDERLVASLADYAEAARSLVSDVRIGSASDLWMLRHSIGEGLKAAGAVIAFDISVPRSRLPELRQTLVAEIAQAYPFLQVCDFGHGGDGGDHFNIVWPHDAKIAYDPVEVTKLRELVYERVVRGFDGSFSAEHGIGPYNLQFYRSYTDPHKRQFAASLKALFDPKGLLGNVDFS